MSDSAKADWHELFQDGQDVGNGSTSLSPQELSKNKGPLLCRVCDKPVAIGNSKTDEDGSAIHEDCYVVKVKRKQASQDGQQNF